MKYTVNKELTTQEIVDIFSTAFTGSCWICIDWDEELYDAAEKELKAARKDVCIEDVLAKLIEDGKSFCIIDEEEGQHYELNEANLRRGCELYETERGSIRKCMDDGAFDLWEGDAIIQYALFGEVIYG